MSRSRKLRMSSTTDDTPQRQAARHLISETIDAIRTGRLRVVDRRPGGYFRPRMEVYNNPDLPNVIATFELPGCKTSDFRITVKKGHLVLEGVRHPRYTPDSAHPPLRTGSSQGAGMGLDSTAAEQAPTHPQADLQYFPMREMRYGTFGRALRLPDGVDSSRIKATMDDGLLTVTWPRSGPATEAGMVSIERPTSSVRAEPPSNHTTSTT